jgi:hypothetical protein
VVAASIDAVSGIDNGEGYRPANDPVVASAGADKVSVLQQLDGPIVERLRLEVPAEVVSASIG